MSIKISEVFQGLLAQQLPALVTILTKAQSYAAESEMGDKSLLDARLHSDMHPLLWQLQTTLELTVRGAARLTEQEPMNLELKEDNFAALIQRVVKVQAELSNVDETALDQSADRIIEIPVGPEATLSMTGQDYVLKFLLPNFYFHLTTVYALLRMNGVPLGKRDYMGPF